MMRRYAPILLVASATLSAQPFLPTFTAADTLTMPCPQDTAVSILTYSGWEAYQTMDDTWDGPRDTTVCIDLAHLVGASVQPRILINQIDAARPVFLRALYDDNAVLPLTTDNQYTFGFWAYSNTLFDLGDCPDGPCTGIRAAVRIPDAGGTGTDLRWYEAPWQEDPWGDSHFTLCVPTEKFAVNELREFILSFKVSNPQPGQFIQYFWSDVIDQDQWGTLVRLTPDNLPQFNVGPQSYAFQGWWWENYLVMHADTSYPDGDHIFHLDFSPVPDQPVPTEITVDLMPYTGFNFQPFTQLRGGLVQGNDTLRHPLTVVNNGADLCLGWEFVEVVWPGGTQYVHESGHVSFEGKNACFQFQSGSTLRVADGSTFQYGQNGRGMLLLIEGSHLEIGRDAELLINGTLIIKEAPYVTEHSDMHVRLGSGARLRFGQGSRLVNEWSNQGLMKLVVTLDGGSIDITGLSPDDRVKVVVVELPQEEWTELELIGNPVAEDLVIAFNSRTEGMVRFRALDAMGRLVVNEQHSVWQGGNRVTIPVQHLSSGTYLLEATFGEERQVVRFVRN